MECPELEGTHRDLKSAPGPAQDLSHCTRPAWTLPSCGFLKAARKECLWLWQVSSVPSAAFAGILFPVASKLFQH